MKVLPTLRQLRYLVAVADHRHFGRAASECLVTQSTLSAGLRELEDILGVTLVERTRREVSVTPLGEAIVERARRLLRGAEDLVDAAQAGSRPLVGLLRLGVIPTVGPYLLPRALPAVRAAYPELRLFLREEQTAGLLDRLASGRLDAAVIALPYRTEGLDAMELGEDRLLVGCPVGHQFGQRDGVAVGDLRGEPMLLLEDGHCLRDHAVTACRLASDQANEAFQATSLGTLVQMVANGLGVTLIPAMAASLETNRNPGIVVVPLSGRQTSRDIALVWRQGSPRAADFRRLGEALRPFVAEPAAAEAV